MVTENYTFVKKCLGCLVEKPLSGFYTWPATGKPRGNCKDCVNAAKRKGPPRRVNFTDGGKICPRCKTEKPLSEYSLYGKQRERRRSRCRQCLRELHAEWNQENREAVCAQASAWKRRNRERVKAIVQNRRSRILDAEGKFSASDIKRLYGLQRGCCATCFKALGSSYHIDHRVAIANGGANDWTNLQLLHPKCNMRKHARDPIEYMQKEHGLLL